MKNENKTVVKSIMSLIENLSDVYAELSNGKSLCITGPAVYKTFRFDKEATEKCVNSERVLIFRSEDLEAFESALRKLVEKNSTGFQIKECAVYEMRLRVLLMIDDLFEPVVISAVADNKFSSYDRLEMQAGFAGILNLKYTDPSWAVDSFVRTYEDLALQGDARHSSYTAQAVIREMLQTKLNLRTSDFWLDEIEDNTYNINKIIKYTNELNEWLGNSIYSRIESEL